jgi:hypothetical protein
MLSGVRGKQRPATLAHRVATDSKGGLAGRPKGLSEFGDGGTGRLAGRSGFGYPGPAALPEAPRLVDLPPGSSELSLRSQPLKTDPSRLASCQVDKIVA